MDAENTLVPCLVHLSQRYHHRTLTLEDVSRFESNLVNRFTQAEQLAYNMGYWAYPIATVLQTELDQSRRQFGVQQVSLRSELADALSSTTTVTPAQRDVVTQEVHDLQA
eukprot:35601-Amphidinium_carterae.1